MIVRDRSLSVRQADRRDCNAVTSLAQRAWPETPFAHAQQPDRAFMEAWSM